jgi:hypothetical protein
MKKLSFITLCLMAAMLSTLAQTNSAKELEAARKTQMPSEKAKSALKTALENEGVITVVDNATGAVLKTLNVNPAETALRTPRGNFHVYITNPQRLAIEYNNVVHYDLYQEKLPQTIPETASGSIVVGAQFSGAQYLSNKVSITILSKKDNVFKLQVSGYGTFSDGNKNKKPASVTGIFEATYLGAVTGQGMPRQQRTKEQKVQDAMKMLEGMTKK